MVNHLLMCMVMSKLVCAGLFPLQQLKVRCVRVVSCVVIESALGEVGGDRNG